MKHYSKLIFALISLALLASTPVGAETIEKMVIALQTDEFELTETDISTLAIGEAQTIETDSGKIIDILRTAEGAEIYVDGELLEMNFDSGDLHEEHVIIRDVEIVCDNDEECSENIIIHVADDSDALERVTADGENVFIHKKVEITCTDDQEGTHCSDQVVWVSDDEGIDIEKLHDGHEGGAGDKFIVIKKTHITDE